jgi:hypothetical protein
MSNVQAIRDDAGKDKASRQLAARSDRETRGATPAFTDNRAQAAIQRAMASAIQGSPAMTMQRRQFDAATGMSAAVQREIDDERTAQGKFPGSTVQRESEAQGKPNPNPNNTGLPDNLKSGIESLSGLSMDGVKVHYNSDKPARLNALAYAQGTDIHVGPGQEQHLPHEAWHVVQQAQGRVQPTMQMNGGVPVNDDASLEHEADVMGAAAKTTQVQNVVQHKISQTPIQTSTVSCVQRVLSPAVFVAMRRRLQTTLYGVGGISPSSSNASTAWTQMLRSVGVLVHSSPTGWSDEAVIDATTNIEVCERVDAKPLIFGLENWQKRHDALAALKELINTLDRDVQQQKLLESIAPQTLDPGRGWQPTIIHIDPSGTQWKFPAGPRDNPQPPRRPNFEQKEIDL